MQNHPGLFIVLEGADGSGKTTQFNLLADKLRRLGHEVEVFDFPRYEKASSHFIRAYLNGEYGPAASINPYTASLFYALDRFEAAPEILKALRSGKIVLSNRYVGSNMAHQGSKFEDEGQQRGFFLWEDGLEYQLLGIPRPTINIFLRVPAEISYELITGKGTRSYTKKSHDEHEADLEHLKKSVATYDRLTQLFPKDFVAVECYENSRLLDISDISKKIWKVVKPFLAAVSKPEGSRQAKPYPPPILVPAHKMPVAQNLQDQATIKFKNISLLAASAVNFIGAKYSYPRPVDFDYYLPENISDQSASTYTDKMEKIKKIHQNIQEALNRYIERHPAYSKIDIEKALLLTMPLSAYVGLSIRGSLAELERLANNFRGHPLPEMRQLAETITQTLTNQGYEFSGNLAANSRDEPEPVGHTLAKIADIHFTQTSITPTDIRLLRPEPRNEFELVSDSGQSDRNSSNTDIGYEQKKQALETDIKQTGGNILNRASYLMEANLDRIDLKSLTERNIIEDLKLQLSSPKDGYDLPKLIEDAGLEDAYSECFNHSQDLFSHLQQVGREEYSGYATMLGHKVRSKFIIRASSLMNAEVKDRSLLEILLRMREAITEVHPIIGEHLHVHRTVSRPAAQKKTPTRRGKQIKKK